MKSSATSLPQGDCAWCREPHGRCVGAVNQARKKGLPLYCDRRCAGMARRTFVPKAIKVAEKAAYDAAYRKKNRAMLKAKKQAYFQRTYDPTRAAKVRKARMHLHVAYCRQPRYKAWKRRYDQQRRDSEYGAFAEAARLAINLNREVKSRSSNYEIRLQNETLNKRLARTRAGAQAARDRHSRAQG